MMLAESISPPVEIAAWLACLAFVVMLANGLFKLVDRFKDKPAPGEVRAESHDKFTTKSEFQQHADWNRREHENLFSKIGGVERGANGTTEKKITELQHERREDMRSLHVEINEVGKKVAGIEATNVIQNQTLAGVTADIKTILGRLPRNPNQ